MNSDAEADAEECKWVPMVLNKKVMSAMALVVVIITTLLLIRTLIMIALWSIQT